MSKSRVYLASLEHAYEDSFSHTVPVVIITKVTVCDSVINVSLVKTPESCCPLAVGNVLFTHVNSLSPSGLDLVIS